MKKIEKQIKNMVNEKGMQTICSCDLKKLNAENSVDLVSDDELERVFGGNMVVMARWTITSRCPSSIGHCC